MPTIQHDALTGAELHEPLGVDTANANEVYLADGAGSGDWTPTWDTYTVTLTDISTADKLYIPIAHSGTVSKVIVALYGTIATANAVITPKDAAGSSMETVTVPYSGSAAGDVVAAAVSTNNTVTADSFMTVETNGASTNTIRATITVIVERS